ncbi:MAG: cell wall-binding repeat-containing protein, partial [Actinobacteria bacterium]|nr:cell wall-binding repeat-containing protein [Actinomycetota bacterium]
LETVIFDGKKVSYTFPTTTTVYYTVKFYAGSLYRIASIVVPAGGAISSVPGAVIPDSPRVNGQLGSWVTETGFSLDGAVTDSFSVAYLLDLSLSSASILSVADQTYTGTAIEPVLTVKDGALTLVKDIDYTVAYTDNTNVGTATATVTGIGNYNGSRSATFTIVPKAITETAVNPILSQVYTGSALEPVVTVTDGEAVLVQGTDYTVAYANNTDAGTATVTVTGIGNYTGTTQATFEIAAKPVLTTTIAPVTDQVFDGSAFEPALTVTDGETVLVQDVDYTVAYSDNTEAGTATVTITGMGNYVGTAQATFSIAAKPFSDKTVVATIDDQIWTGLAIEPAVSVTDGETVLVQDVDYTVSYTDNIEAGTATATITGIGNYSGTLQANFSISQETLQVAGVDRSATAAQTALAAYSDGAEGVIIASAGDFPDAYTASSLAGLLDYPILLCGATTLGTSTADAIRDLGATNVIIVGGTGVIPTAVETELAGLGITIDARLAGDDRYGTADAVYEYGAEHGTWSDTAIVTTGSGFADALSISPFVVASDSPVILTAADGSLPESAQAELSNSEDVVIVGGTAVVPIATEDMIAGLPSAPTITRLAGDDRYATSLAIANWCTEHGYLSWDGAAFATGENFPDALTGGVLQGKTGSVLLLADSDSSVGMTCVDAIGLHADSVSKVCFLGGLGATTQALRDAVMASLGW